LQVIAINGKFPGPVINVTTNNHVAVNVYNQLDEDLLITWLVSHFHCYIAIFYYTFQLFIDKSFWTSKFWCRLRCPLVYVCYFEMCI